MIRWSQAMKRKRLKHDMSHLAPRQCSTGCMQTFQGNVGGAAMLRLASCRLLNGPCAHRLPQDLLRSFKDIRKWVTTGINFDFPMEYSMLLLNKPLSYLHGIYRYYPCEIDLFILNSMQKSNSKNCRFWLSRG